VSNHNLTFCIIIISSAFSNEYNSKKLSNHLFGFENFIDKSFEGEFYNSTKTNPLKDIIRFERILNGEAISITHSVNHGEYGGRYIITWNSEKEKLESYYFSTGGEIILSKVNILNNEIILEEDFSNYKNGIKKVQKIFRINESGKLENNIKYLMNSHWVNAHEINYDRNDKAKIIFR